MKASELIQKIEFQQAETLTDKGKKGEKVVRILPALESHLRPLIDSLKTDSDLIGK
jgi:hypothetical protein